MKKILWRNPDRREPAQLGCGHASIFVESVYFTKIKKLGGEVNSEQDDLQNPIENRKP